MESKKSQPQPPKDASSSGDAKKIVDLEKAVKDLTELAARSQAELQNAKIRMEKEAISIFVCFPEDIHCLARICR
jgi:molecular chaperone GrpE (heat shock protein)